MTTSTFRLFLSFRRGAIFSALLFIFAVTGLSAAHAQADSPESSAGSGDRREIGTLGTQEILNADGTYQSSIDGNAFSRPRPANNLIRLRRAPAFDPLVGGQPAAAQRSSSLAPSLYVRDAGRSVDAYIVQFHTQAHPDYQRAIENAGAEIVTALPPNALIVLMSRTAKTATESMPFVRATTDYLPAYKLQEGLENVVASGSGAIRTYSIMAVSQAHRAALVRFTESIGGVVLSGDPAQSRSVDLRTSASASSRFSANLNADQLLRVAQQAETLFIDLRGEEGEDLDQVRQREEFDYIEQVAGYCGQGVGFEVYDRGYRLSHQELVNKPILVRSPQASGSGGLNHGTEIAGIVYGEGIAMSGGLIRCAARPIVFSRFSGFPSNNQPTESQLRGHLAELIDPSGPYRAIAQTSSTDYTQTTQYTTWSAEYDEVLFDLDFIKLQSQSNEGNRNSRPAAWAKNVVAVGGFHTEDTIDRSDDNWNRASIGPAADDRIKPDLSGQYGGIRTIDDVSDTAYRDFGGTSGATPTVGAAFAIMFQMWADGVFAGGPGQNRDVFDVRPHAATARALMIHSAFRYNFSGGDSANMSRVHQGWGAPDLRNLYDAAQANGWTLPILINEDDVVTPGGVNAYTLTVDGSQALKATMVYRDLRGNPAAAVHRINDLSLRVTSPTGTVYWGNNGLRGGNWSTPGGNSNTIDPVENVFIQAPEAGTWDIEVLGDDIVMDGHTATPATDAVYALVVTGGSSTPPVNQAPVVDAGANQTIQLPASANLMASVSDDGLPSGSTVSTNWSVVSGPGGVTFGNAAAVNTTAAFSAPGTYVLRITASDTELSSSDDVTITVDPPPANQAPVVNAGSNQTIVLPATASLDGTVSDDGLPLGANVTTSWSQVSGPGSVAFGNAAAIDTTASFSTDGTYVLRLTANDTALSNSDDVTITVNPEPPNAPPSVNAGSDQNAVVGVALTLNGSVSDDGRPNPPGAVTVGWSQVSGPDTASFGNAASAVTDVTLPVEGSYVLRLTANDGAASSSDELTVTAVAAPVVLEAQDFESGQGNWLNVTAGDDEDWTRDSGGTPSNNTGPDSGNAGSTWYMYLETSNNQGAFNAGDTAILEGPDIASGNNRSLSFFYHMYGSNMGTLNVDVQSGGVWTDGVWSISGQQQSSNSAAYSQATVDLNGFSGVIRVRFRAVAAGDFRGDMAIDDIEISGILGPPVNQAPVVDAGADQTVILPDASSLSGSVSDDGLPAGAPVNSTWSQVSGPGTVGFGNASSVNTTASFPVAGTYVLRLTASDTELSASDDIEVTVLEPGSTPVVLEAEGFESGQGNWANVTTGDNEDWTRDSGGTPSNNTGPNDGNAGSTWYMYLETSNNQGAFNAGDSAILEGPIVNGSSRVLTFFYHMYGSDMGTLNVDVESGGVWIESVWSVSGQQQSGSSAAYLQATVDLNSFSGPIRVRFRGVAAGDFRGDMAIDDIEITGILGPPVNQAPMVNAGADQTVILPETATLNGSVSDDGLPAAAPVTSIWTQVTGPGTVSFGDASAAVTTASFPAAGTYLLRLTGSDTALSASDDVEITVLDAGSTPVVLEAESFENGQGNWANVTTGDNEDWTRDSGGTPSNNTGPNGGNNGSSWYMYLETSESGGAFNAGDTAILLGPTINGAARTLTFFYHMYGSNMGTLNVDVESGGVWTEGVWTISGQQQSSSSAAYAQATVDLGSFSGPIRVRYRAVAAGNFRGDMAIDDIEITGVN